MANQELDALDPVPAQLTLSTGTVVVIEDLRARQFFKFLRIITRGALPAMQDMSIFNVDGNLDAREFGGRLLSLMLLSIPEAENEAIEFVQAMCKPAGLIERRGLGKLNKQDQERNTALWATFLMEMDNPELDDLVSIIEVIVKREAADIQALGKRLGAMLKIAEKTGQIPEQSPSRTSQDENSSEDSVEPSTYSPPPTDGPTITFSGSPSDGFANVSPPFQNVVTTTSGIGTSG